jgi:hypothetical protein
MEATDLQKLAFVAAFVVIGDPDLHLLVPLEWAAHFHYPLAPVFPRCPFCL